MNRKQSACSALLAGLLVSFGAGCDDIEGENPAESTEPLPAAFEEASALGLVMDGYRDVEGLTRVLEHHFDTRLVRGALFDDSLALSHGIDAQTVREMEALARGIDLGVFRVEYIPGFAGGADGMGFRWDRGAQGGGADDTFIPGFPGRESLASQGATWTTTIRGGEYHHQRNYPDGSTWSITERIWSGGRERKVVTTNPDGSIRHYEYERTNAEGERTEREERGQDDGPPNQAEEDRQDAESGGSGEETGGGEGEEDPVDKLQPAEGGGGTFCPLTVDVCRRGLEDALNSVDDVLVGMVLVNPGEPNDQPPASRLFFDPQDLVINPDPERAYERDAEGIDPRGFKMRIPVWVNPPGPAHE